jgi:hypothetical protein
MNRCRECGALTADEFCRKECEDLFVYGSSQAGRSLLPMRELGSISTKGHRPKIWEPPSVPASRQPIDYEKLPF